MCFNSSFGLIHVNLQTAQELGQADEKRLLDTRKLVLLVDLDETILHTTNDNVPANLQVIKSIDVVLCK